MSKVSSPASARSPQSKFVSLVLFVVWLDWQEIGTKRVVAGQWHWSDSAAASRAYLQTKRRRISRSRRLHRKHSCRSTFFFESCCVFLSCCGPFMYCRCRLNPMASVPLYLLCRGSHSLLWISGISSRFGGSECLCACWWRCVWSMLFCESLTPLACRFKSRTQQINALEGTKRAKATFMEQLKKHLAKVWQALLASRIFFFFKNQKTTRLELFMKKNALTDDQ